jgi:tetratricopeptide (TPR) repeat protein
LGKFITRAGSIACLVICAACAAAAFFPITPAISFLVIGTDQPSREEILALEKKHDWPGMLKYARAKLQSESRNSDWWFLQGYALARQEKHAEAVDSYKQALGISPEDEGSWIYMGYSQIELGQPDHAIRTFEQALRYRPTSAITYLALADAYAKKDQPVRAIPNYLESVRYQPDLMEGWYGLAVAYQKMGMSARRDGALQSVRKLDPSAAAAFEKQYLSK